MNDASSSGQKRVSVPPVATNDLAVAISLAPPAIEFRVPLAIRFLGVRDYCGDNWRLFVALTAQVRAIDLVLSEPRLKPWIEVDGRRIPIRVELLAALSSAPLTEVGSFDIEQVLTIASRRVSSSIVQDKLIARLANKSVAELISRDRSRAVEHYKAQRRKVTQRRTAIVR